MQDAERLAAWLREAEGFQQAFRLSMAQHAPDRLWKEYQSFLAERPAETVSPEEVKQRAARFAQAAQDTRARQQRRQRKERRRHGR